MPTSLVGLSVFASGTSETDAERSALKLVVQELAGVLEKTHALTLRLLSWPDSFRPAVSSDPQAAINEQLPNYDIYIGIIGSRFGSPTPRSGSGTQEEFEEALSRYRKDSSTVRLLFYFLRTAQDPFTIDHTQLGLVKDFRASLGPQGVFFKDVADTSTFVSTVRSDLQHLVIDEWRATAWSTKQTSAVTQLKVVTSDPSPPTNEESDDEEFGLIELSEERFDLLDSLEKIVTVLTGEIEKMTAGINAGTSDLVAINADLHLNPRAKAAKFKTASDEAAEHLEKFAASFSTHMPRYKELAAKLFTCFERVRQAQLEFGHEPSEEEKSSTERMLLSLEGSFESTADLQAQIAAAPALTKRFRFARKKAAQALGEFVAASQLMLMEGRKYSGRPQSH